MKQNRRWIVDQYPRPRCNLCFLSVLNNVRSRFYRIRPLWNVNTKNNYSTEFIFLVIGTRFSRKWHFRASNLDQTITNRLDMGLFLRALQNSKIPGPSKVKGGVRFFWDIRYIVYRYMMHKTMCRNPMLKNV